MTPQKRLRVHGAVWASILSTSAGVATAQEKPTIVRMDMLVNQRVPMRDGVTLAARVWKPVGDGRYPVVMVQTPYLSDETHLRARKFVAAGYVYVSVDRRGRGTSEGKFVPLADSGRDGADAIAWLARQPWSDGRIVTRGGSYRGMVQWQTLAQAPSALVAAVPTASVYPGWDFPAPRGIPLPYMASWLAFTEGTARNALVFRDSLYWRDKFLRVHRGEVTFDQLARISGAPEGHFQRWLAHPGYDEYWRSINPKPAQYAKMTPPILSITGYFDGDQEGALRYYEEHQRFAPKARAQQHVLLIGPWDHAGTRSPRKSVGGLEFNPRSVLDLDALHIEWFDHVLRGRRRPKALAGRVNYYVIGAEEWRSAPSLDAVADEEWTLYLSSGGAAMDSLFASGKLIEEESSDDGPSRFRFDPRIDREPEDWATREPPQDGYISQDDALRPDRLFFHSEPMTRSRTVCGRINLEAQISIDVRDTDVEANLYELTARNRLRWLGGDRMRARFRKGYDRERLAKPGALDTWNFNRFWWTCRRLEVGSRLRLVIGPSDSPAWQKNYNTGGRIGFERPSDAQVATITLHHSRDRPSILRLPTASSPQ